LPTLGDGNCFFHSVLRAFNTNYIKAKSITDRVNMARTFRNALADLLEEIDPLTGKNYYSGLNNGELEKISGGVIPCNPGSVFSSGGKGLRRNPASLESTKLNASCHLSNSNRHQTAGHSGPRPT
jgi:hypothetical protein